MIELVKRKYVEAYSGLPREVWYLSLALFINRCGAMVLAFLTLYLTEKMGFTEDVACRMLSVYGIGAIFGNYVGGKLTNRVGSIRLQIVMLLAAAPMFLLLPVFTSWIGIASVVFVLSLFFEGVRPANSTAVAQFTPLELQPKAFALQRMAVNLGYSFGPFVGGYLAEIDYFWIFLVDALSTVGAAAILMYLFGLKRFSKTMTKEQQAVLEKRVDIKLASPLRDPAFLFVMGLMLLAAIVFFQFHALYPLYLKEHFQLRKIDIGRLFAINTVLIVIFEMVLIDYIKTRNPLKVIGWGTFLSCIGFGIMPFSQAIWFCIFSMCVLTLGEMLWSPICSGWVGQRSERGDRAMYMSYYTINYSMAAVIAPTLGGAIYKIDPHLYWYISLGIAFVVLAGFYGLANRMRRDEEPAVPIEDSAKHLENSFEQLNA